VAFLQDVARQSAGLVRAIIALCRRSGQSKCGDVLPCIRLANVNRLSGGEAPVACGEAACRLPQPESGRRARSASGVTPCTSGGKRRFAAESGERPAIRCWQKLGGATVADCESPRSLTDLNGEIVDRFHFKVIRKSAFFVSIVAHRSFEPAGNILP
jgi:hypothetical protein